MFTQLTTPLPVLVDGKGNGTAIGVIDYGPEHDLIWITAIEETGRICRAPSAEVRLRDSARLARSARAIEGWKTPENRTVPIAREPEPRAVPRLQGIAIPGADAEHAAFP